MLGEFKTEIVGISAEVAIADEYGVAISADYRCRADERVIAMTRGVVREAFSKHNISVPVRHIAEGQNPIDFVLKDNGTLSVKSNQRGLGKVAPQNVGQPTALTYWTYFKDFADDDVSGDYKKKAAMFKRVSLARIDELLKIYWQNMFECDKLLHFYDFINKNGGLNARPKYISFSKLESPNWEKDKFSFTQTAATWNESNTVKYCRRSIGEFQVHNNRDCFKFRFNMDSIATLIAEGLKFETI